MRKAGGTAKGGGPARAVAPATSAPRAATVATHKAPVPAARAVAAASRISVAAKGGSMRNAKAAGTGAALPAAASASAGTAPAPVVLDEDELEAEERLAQESAHRCFAFDEFPSDCEPGVAEAGASPLVDGEDFVLSRAGGFRLDRSAERENVLRLLACQRREAASRQHNLPLLVLAASGMGKSTLLAQVVQAARDDPHYDVVHSVFIGSVEGSSDALCVGRALCSALSHDIGAPQRKRSAVVLLRCFCA